MNVVSLSMGAEDYGRDQMLRVTVMGISIALGHNYTRWFVVNIDVEWRHSWYWGFGYVEKRVHGEQFFEMLLRRYAPGWMAR